MDTERLARGWSLIAEGAMEISLAYSAIDPAARAGSAGAEAGSSPLPPSVPARTTQEQHLETVLGECPDHQVPWEVKAGGISKAGKPYRSFWRCNQRTEDGYCAKRPVKAWVDTHPIREAA